MVRILNQPTDTSCLGSSGHWLKDIAYFWVGLCFWESIGFYSVTGHRVRELGSGDF
jgi:hypothetical protein